MNVTNVNNIPTELSLTILPSVLNSSPLNQHSDSNYKNYHYNKKNHIMLNNINYEVNQIKQKKTKDQINYLKIIEISYEENQNSLKEINNIIEHLDNEDITDILSIKKLTSVYKHIFEIFSFFIGETYFEWKSFREKLNLHEVKFKMANLDIKHFNEKVINNFLNKVSKDERINEDFISEYKIKGVHNIFRFIKAVFRVFLYNFRNKIDKSERKSNLNSVATSNAFGAPFNKTEFILKQRKNRNLSKKNVRIICLDKSVKFKNEKIESFENLHLNLNLIPFDDISHNNSSVTMFKNNNSNFLQIFRNVDRSKSDLFFTNINPVDFPTNTNTTDSQSGLKNYLKNNEMDKTSSNIITIKKKLPKLKIVDKKIKLNFDIVEEKIQKEKKHLNSMPFAKHKTFGRMREYFHLNLSEKQSIADKHYQDIEKLSIRNPINADKILNIISKNKMKEVEDSGLKMYLNVLKKDDEDDKDVIKVRFKK